MLQSSLFWNKLDVALYPNLNINSIDKIKQEKEKSSALMIEEDEGRAGHAIFYQEDKFFVIGGEENTHKNWIEMKEKARKQQMIVADDKKRSSSIQPMQA